MSSTATIVVQPLTFPGIRPDDGPAPAAGAARERLAAIDIGSNSIHMVVAETEPNGGYRMLGREREMVRLGSTGFGEGALSEAAMLDGLESLARMTTMARLKGRRAGGGRRHQRRARGRQRRKTSWPASRPSPASTCSS